MSSLRFTFWTLVATALLSLVVLMLESRQNGAGVGALDNKILKRHVSNKVQGPPPTLSTNAIQSGDAESAVAPKVAFEHWLSVAPLRRKILISEDALRPLIGIIDSMNLSSERKLRLEELIVEREESLEDSEDLAKAGKIGPDGTIAVREISDASFNRDLSDVVGDTNAPIVQQMLRLRPQLADVFSSIGASLDEKLIPLSADQTMKMAQIYKDVYAPDSSRWPVTEQAGGLDPLTGLNAGDREALRLAGDVLTREQLDRLRAGLAKCAANSP